MESLGGYWREEYFIYETRQFGTRFLCYIKDINVIAEFDLNGSLMIEDVQISIRDESTPVECDRCGFESVIGNISDEWELIKGYKFDEVEENMSVAEFIEERLTSYILAVLSENEFILCSECAKELELRLDSVIDSDLQTELVTDNI